MDQHKKTFDTPIPESLFERSTIKEPIIPRRPKPRGFLPSKPLDQLETRKMSAIPVTERPYNALRGDSDASLIDTVSMPIEGTQAPSFVPETPRNVPFSRTKDHAFSERVDAYTSWLTKQATRPVRVQDVLEKEQYVKESIQPIRVGKQEVMTFAPFRKELSALQTITTKQMIFLVVCGLAWIVCLYFFRLTVLTAAIGAITSIYTICLLINVMLALRSFNAQTEEQFDDELLDALESVPWPSYTILCPLYKEANMIPQFVSAMEKLEYPEERLQILLLTEEHDRETRKAIRALSLPEQFEIVVVPDGAPRTKPRACNYGLLRATGEYVVIFDAEDIPDPLQLKKAVLSFANNDIDTVCVQAKLNFYNSKQNLLTRWFTAEYSTWFEFILPALQHAGFVLPLGGTSNHFRTASLRALGGWDAYNVTEDCDLGLRLKRFNMKTVMVDSTTLEEANPNLKNWFRQRSRWIKGYMQTYLVHMRTPLKTLREGRWKDFFSFQVVIGSGIGVLFFNPLMWALLALYLVKGASVIDLYHLLFPGPFLYMGAFCLIFGNFFYVYLYLLSCTKKENHHILVWATFIPLYWFLMTLAGFYAFVELLLRPHYWQKTIHGFHMKGAPKKQSIKDATFFVDVQTQSSIPVLPAIKREKNIFTRTVTSTMKAITTLPLPALSLKQREAKTVIKQAKAKNLWIFLVSFISSITSIIFTKYYYDQKEILLYQDALSHMRISRGVFDSLTPGLAQLGTVWLPLPHILMWPFIWNNFLWHSGLAGSFASMICYVISSDFLFLCLNELVKDAKSSFLGTVVFCSNPNVLYLQSSPLSELVCLATAMIACYYFICWIKEDNTESIIKAAIACFLATLSRYDGWPLFAFMLIIIVAIGIFKRKKFLKIQSSAFLFSLIGGLGIFLWFIWNQFLFGSPFYFKNSIYSSEAQQKPILLSNQLYTYHSLILSIKYYVIDFETMIGLIMFFLFFIGFIIMVLKMRKSFLIFSVSLFFIPIFFYVSALYSGNATLWIPGANPSGSPEYLYNTRYGVQMIPAISLCIAFLANSFITFFKKIKIKNVTKIVFVVIMLLILYNSFDIQNNGVVVLQDGQYNTMCQPNRATITYLEEHYNGGLVLEDIYADGFDVSDAGIDFHNVVYEGSNIYWKKYLKNPYQDIQWIMVNFNNVLDVIPKNIDLNSPLFLKTFTMVVVQTNQIALYHKNGMPLANKKAPVSPNFPHHVCLSEGR